MLTDKQLEEMQERLNNTYGVSIISKDMQNLLNHIKELQDAKIVIKLDEVTNEELDKLQELIKNERNTIMEVDDNNGWLKCSDRLPEDKEMVLIYIPNNNSYFDSSKPETRVIIDCARFRTTKASGNNKKNYEWRNPPMTYFGQDVTHWMPLPQLPIDGDKNG